ncbi:MAG: 50S ribosome-binding GTPase, partial [Phycisphaerales bacterium]|nr:50S ribosome-binding GTPase [Phycisphaerales bacterium]
LTAISGAHPKIADYPFTTTSPHLGITEISGERRLVVADLPGLIEGAADGAGMGHDFLKHVERTAVILHVVEVQPVDGSDPLENWRTIRGELEAFGDILAHKPEVVLLNKCDLIDEGKQNDVMDILRDGTGKEVLPASGMTGEGMGAVLERLWAIARPPVETGWKA